jgi:alpha-galactosidase
VNIAASVLLAWCVFAQSAGAAEKKLKVFILAGQSNMVGHSKGHTMGTLFNADGPRDKALIDLVFGKSTKLSKKRYDETLAIGKQLNELTGGAGDKKIKGMKDATEKAAAEAKVAPMKAALEAYQKDVVAASAISDRVYINAIADGNRKSGKLSVGYGADPSKIGPEYAFGLSVAQKIDGPILIIKTSWGGKSIHFDFRPPSRPDYKETKSYQDYLAAAKKYETDLAAYNDAMKSADGEAKKKLRKPRAPRPVDPAKAGHFWREMVKQVNTVLADPKQSHPDYDADAGYEIAGFVWFQGFNDQFSDDFRDSYKDNMVAFIKDIRKEYKTPQMPFVIGVLGTGKTKEKVDENAVSVAQRAVADVPEFKGTVVAVESYTEQALDSWEVFNAGWAKNLYVWSLVGNYLGAGKFFVRLGDAFATAMAGMMAK